MEFKPIFGFAQDTSTFLASGNIGELLALGSAFDRYSRYPNHLVPAWLGGLGVETDPPGSLSSARIQGTPVDLTGLYASYGECVLALSAASLAANRGLLGGINSTTEIQVSDPTGIVFGCQQGEEPRQDPFFVVNEGRGLRWSLMREEPDLMGNVRMGYPKVDIEIGHPGYHLLEYRLPRTTQLQFAGNVLHKLGFAGEADTGVYQYNPTGQRVRLKNPAGEGEVGLVLYGDWLRYVASCRADCDGANAYILGLRQRERPNGLPEYQPPLEVYVYGPPDYKTLATHAVAGGELVLYPDAREDLAREAILDLRSPSIAAQQPALAGLHLPPDRATDFLGPMHDRGMFDAVRNPGSSFTWD